MDPQKKPFSANEPTDPAASGPDMNREPADTPAEHSDSNGPAASPQHDASADSFGAPDSKADAGSAASPPAPGADIDDEEAHAAAILNAAAGHTAVSSPTPPASSVPATGAPASADLTPDSPPPGTEDSSSVLGAAPAPAGAMAPGAMPSRGSKKMLIVLIIITAVVVLLGASAAAWYMVVNKPQNVLNAALRNSFSASKAKTVTFDGSIDIKPKDSTSIGATFSGGSTKDGAVTLTAKLDAMVATINLDARTVDGKTFYMRVGGLDGLVHLLGMSSSSSAEMSVLAPIIAKLNNQWIEFNQSMIEQLTGMDATAQTKLSDADRQKLLDAYKKNQFMVVSKTLKDEEIKDQKSHHYQVTIDSTKLKAYIAAVKSANIQSVKITAESQKAFNEAVDKIHFAKYPLDVWIAKDSKMIDQISFNAEQGGTSVNMRFTIDGYNKPVNVEVPTGAKSLLDVLNQLFSGSLSSGQSGGIQALGSGISL